MSETGVSETGPSGTGDASHSDGAGSSGRWMALSGLAANLAVIATIGAMWLIYTGEREDARDLMRRELALGMLEISHGETVTNAERRVSAFMVANYERYVLAYARGEPATNGDASLLDDQMRADYVTLTDYYNDVLLCRESGNCDADMIDSWFKEDICNFTEFATYIGWPQLREQFGEALGARLVGFYESDCQS